MIYNDFSGEIGFYNSCNFCFFTQILFNIVYEA